MRFHHNQPAAWRGFQGSVILKIILLSSIINTVFKGHFIELRYISFVHEIQITSFKIIPVMTERIIVAL